MINLAPDSAERFQHTVSDVSSTTIPYMPWAPSHETHFAIAFDMFLQNPIFGQGPQLFKTLCLITPEYLSACTSHPHNYYVQTLGEMGILGFLFIFIFFIYILFDYLNTLLLCGLQNQKKIFCLTIIFFW